VLSRDMSLVGARLSAITGHHQLISPTPRVSGPRGNFAGAALDNGVVERAVADSDDTV